MKRLLFLALTSVVSTSWGQMTPAERRGVDDALSIANVSRAETKLDRRPAGLNLLPVVDRSLRDPLTVVDVVGRIHALNSKPLAEEIAGTIQEVFGGSKETGEVREASVDSRVPLPLKKPLGQMVAALAAANLALKAATSQLTAEERRTLIEGLPQWASGDPRLPISFVKVANPDSRRLLSLLKKLDTTLVRTTGTKLLAELTLATAALKEAAKGVDLPRALRFRASGVEVELSGRRDDRHDARDVMLCVDLGGDDTYSGRYAAGIGYTAALVDLSGNDTYEGDDANIGSGILGCGIAFDLAGRDVYRCGSVSLGSGLGGFGVLWDAGGDDTYRGIGMTQGFGAYGIGVLRDDSGRDTYDAAMRGQGSGRTAGLGLLVDASGDDLYRLGGALGNGPRNLINQRGYGQGYGGGFDELGDQPGGAGVLADLGGDDSYLGGVGVQASASDGGLGSLFDASGDDTYRARRDAQGFSKRGSVAQFLDGQGSDSYTVMTGPGFGFASEKAVSCFVDRAGDDLYNGRDARPAVAVSGGLALFLDDLGSDRYPGPPSLGDDADDAGSLALFVDMEGDDLYPEGLANASSRSRSDAWAMIDAETSAADGPSAVVPLAIGSAANPGEARIEELYQAALRDSDYSRLVAIGTPAFVSSLDRHLPEVGTRSGEPLVVLAKVLGDAALPALIERARKPVQAASVLRLIGLARLAGAQEIVSVGVEEPATAVAGAYAAGRLGLKTAVPAINRLAAPGDRERVVTALSALAQIGDRGGVDSAVAYLSSNDLVLRRLARRIVSFAPDRAIEIARSGLIGADIRQQRFMIELLGEVGTPAALKLVEPYLAVGPSDTKIAALLAFRDRIPTRLLGVLESLRHDVDPLVRTVANGLDFEP